jgi:hypothetical protein
LIFSDDDVLPLDKFVFNTEAHPFRIRNWAYCVYIICPLSFICCFVNLAENSIWFLKLIRF